MNDLRRPELERGAEHQLRAVDVRLAHRGGGLSRDADLVDGGAVDGRVAAREAAPDRTGVAEVAPDELVVEALRPVRVAHERDDLVAPHAQATGDLADDEPGRARDEDSHPVSLPDVTPQRRTALISVPRPPR